MQHWGALGRCGICGASGTIWRNWGFSVNISWVSSQHCSLCCINIFRCNWEVTEITFKILKCCRKERWVPSCLPVLAGISLPVPWLLVGPCWSEITSPVPGPTLSFSCVVFLLQMAWMANKPGGPIPAPRWGSFLTMAWIAGRVFTSSSQCIPSLDEERLVSVFSFFITCSG